MQTCRACRSEDIPDKATHCRHCGRRLKPSELPATLGLVAFILILIYMLWTRALAPAMAHAEAREKARRLVDDLQNYCSPTLPPADENLAIQLNREKLRELDLDYNDRTIFEASFDNRLAQLGCGRSRKAKPAR